MGLKVAVTGPTGEIGKPFIRLLERSRQVEEVVGMARRPFDPQAHGWRKTRYVQGDVANPRDVAALVTGADVVVHLAFAILGAGRSREVNLDGTRTVFEQARDAGAQRVVHASSVAAYGFHPDNPQPLTEDVPARGTDSFPYSAQKAELERVLREVLGPSPTQAYVVRPCVVAGPEAPALVNQIPYVRWGEKLPAAVRALAGRVPGLTPVLPDPGVPFQLVHHDDMAAALRSAVLGKGRPGVYNVAGPGTLTLTDLAHELGWRAVPVPDLAVDATAALSARLPFLPEETRWVVAAQTPVLMDTAKARRELGWRPKHDAQSTLRTTVAGVRAVAAGHDPSAHPAPTAS